MTIRKLTLSETSKQTIRDNQEFVDKWIAGLRSGKYTQHRGAMVDPDIPNSACCLMVMEMECNGREWEDHADYHDGQIANYPSLLHNGIKWPEKLSGECGWNPSDWNDLHRLSYDQIADLLEQGEIEYECN